MPLQIRRGLNAERTQITPANGLVEGELLYTTDEKKLYIGTGSTGEHQGVVITGYTNNDAKDAAAQSLTTGEHTGINFSYNSSTKTLNATVNLSAFDGPIVADALKGSVFADDSSILLDAIDKVLYANVVGNVTGNLAGSVTGNLAGNVIGNVIGDITGNVTGNVSGNLVGDITGSVFADDSTVIIDGTSGNITGNLTGPVFANDTTLLVDNVNNVISNGILSISDKVLSSNLLDIAFESAGGLFRYSCIGSQPDPAEGLGDSIVGAVNNFTGLDLNAVPPDLSSSFVAGDITSTIKFVSLDTTRSYRSVVLGAQIDKTAFTESYAPSKFFMVVFPDEDRDVEEGQAVEDVIRYVTYDPYGRFGVGRENAKATLDVNGFMKLKVLPTEPTVVEDSSIPDGFVAIADGVNWDPLSNGKQSMVVRLGGTWVQMAVAP
jgi:hypothetical protein